MKPWPADPPPGPARAGFWRSPLRGPWLTSLLGSLLLPIVLLIGLTGFLSHAAYNPLLGDNAVVPRGGDVLTFDWPTSPAWLYAATQGFHVVAGIVALPLLLAKLWSVVPRLFGWPPVRSPAHALERLSLVGLVGGGLFEFVTGIFNAQLFYPWPFNFVVAHYYGAWVFLGALVLHVAVKLPLMRRVYAERGVRRMLRSPHPEPYEPDGLAPPEPAAPSISRRGLLGLVGAASGALLVSAIGRTVGGPLRGLSLFSSRGAGVGSGPNAFPVNKTAALARVTPAMAATWALDLRGPQPRTLDRDALLGMELATHDLPIACVEGWTTTQRWTGVRLRDLAALCGASGAREARVESLQPRGAFRQATLSADQIADERSLLALRVNGVDLSLDHGFPARIIVPALPGVHNTKWVASVEFRT